MPGIRNFIGKVREPGFIVDELTSERVRIVGAPENIDTIAESVLENPSTRHRSQELNISRISLRRILRKDLV